MSMISSAGRSQTIADTKEIAGRLRIEADYRHGYRKYDVSFNAPNYPLDDSVPMAFGANGMDEMDMPIYKLFNEPADIIDPQKR